MLKLREVDELDELYTIEEFKVACSQGCFIDYDGSGYLAYKDKFSDIPAPPSQILKSKFDFRDFTHVVWFNK